VLYPAELRALTVAATFLLLPSQVRKVATSLGQWYKLLPVDVVPVICGKGAYKLAAPNKVLKSAVGSFAKNNTNYQ